MSYLRAMKAPDKYLWTPQNSTAVLNPHGKFVGFLSLPASLILTEVQRTFAHTAAACRQCPHHAALLPHRQQVTLLQCQDTDMEHHALVSQEKSGVKKLCLARQHAGVGYSSLDTTLHMEEDHPCSHELVF